MSAWQTPATVEAIKTRKPRAMRPMRRRLLWYFEEFSRAVGLARLARVTSDVPAE
jgi:hypothetical protein